MQTYAVAAGRDTSEKKWARAIYASDAKIVDGHGQSGAHSLYSPATFGDALGGSWSAGRTLVVTAASATGRHGIGLASAWCRCPYLWTREDHATDGPD